MMVAAEGEEKMAHPIRYQSIGPFKFYRMGTTLIADKGNKTFVILKYSGDAGFEASVRARHGLKMPIRGDIFHSIRAAAEYLLPYYLELEK